MYQLFMDFRREILYNILIGDGITLKISRSIKMCIKNHAVNFA